jgi:hypothetical protein
MAAGLGFKTFTTGEVLTAADVNGYLMQGVLVFASEAARDAAITSPQEGQFAFTKDNNSLWYYDSVAWVASGATGDIEGVTAGTGISGGGTSGTVTITNSMATAIDAKADLVVGTGADTFSVLAVGANGTVLTAASGEATGLEWAAPASAGKGYTLINSGGTALTGAQTITVSGLGNYESYIIYCNASSANTGSSITFRLNADSGANYTSRGVSISNAAAYTSAFLNNVEQDGATEYDIGGTATNLHTGYLTIGIRIEGGKSTDAKAIQVSAGFWEGSARTGQRTTVSTGLYLGTSAITSFSLLSSSGNFDQGTLFIYGSSN